MVEEEGKKEDPPLIEVALNRFLNGMFGIQKTFEVVVPHISEWMRTGIGSIEEKYKNYKKLEEDGSLVFNFNAAVSREMADMMEFRRSIEEITAVDYNDVVATCLFTQIFCEFDSFMGELLKAIYKSKPALYSSLERKISASELMSFDGISGATEFLLDQEIDAFRRDSYVEQFSNLEAKFSVKTKEFKEWPAFVELSQRRNLLTHNGGVVSDQYLAVCKREGISDSNFPQVGEKLRITPDYLAKALLVIRKVAFMLTHTLWRKVLPNESEKAHGACHSAIYEMLQRKMWLTAAELGTFSLSPMLCKNLSDQHRRMRVINTAIGYKFSGNDSVCKQLLEKEDWTSSFRDFKLAVSVLTDKLDDVWPQMLRIGKQGEMIEELAYRDWPLFHRLRQEPKFHEVFHEIYGEHFSYPAHSHSPTIVVDADGSEVVDSIASDSTDSDSLSGESK